MTSELLAYVQHIIKLRLRILEKFRKKIEYNILQILLILFDKDVKDMYVLYIY